MAQDDAATMAAVRYWPAVTVLDWRETRSKQRPEHHDDEAKQGQRGDRLDQREPAPVVGSPDGARHRTTLTRPALDMVICRLACPEAMVTVNGRVATPVGDTVTLASESDQRVELVLRVRPERPALVQRAGREVANLDCLVDAVAGNGHGTALPAGQGETALQGQCHEARGAIHPRTAERPARCVARC